MRTGIHLVLSLIAVPACIGTAEATSATAIPVGRDRACAGNYAASLEVPVSAIRVAGRDTAPSGNDLVFLETAESMSTAACEVDQNGTIVAITPLF